jgi:hypothetical protein
VAAGILPRRGGGASNLGEQAVQVGGWRRSVEGDAWGGWLQAACGGGEASRDGVQQRGGLGARLGGRRRRCTSWRVPGGGIAR